LAYLSGIEKIVKFEPSQNLNHHKMDDPATADSLTIVKDAPDAIKEKDDSIDPVIVTRIATKADVKYVYVVLEEMERSAKARGTGIARRSPQSICQKIYDGKAVIALTGSGDWVGFSYIEAWSSGQFVSNSGLIVNPVYRRGGAATAIKDLIFRLSRGRYPAAKIFSITTGEAVLKMNAKLGFEPVTYSRITADQPFWDQCKACVNYPVLESQHRKICLCSAMVYDPRKEAVWRGFSI
jgi:hypothetical protein